MVDTSIWKFSKQVNAPFRLILVNKNAYNAWADNHVHQVCFLTRLNSKFWKVEISLRTQDCFRNELWLLRVFTFRFVTWLFHLTKLLLKE